MLHAIRDSTILMRMSFSSDCRLGHVAHHHALLLQQRCPSKCCPAQMVLSACFQQGLPEPGPATFPLWTWWDGYHQQQLHHWPRKEEIFSANNASFTLNLANFGLDLELQPEKSKICIADEFRNDQWNTLIGDIPQWHHWWCLGQPS